MGDSLIKMVLDNDLIALKDFMNTNVQKHIDSRIAEKKIDVIAQLNNVSSEKMREIINTGTK